MPKKFYNRFFYISLALVLIGILCLFLPHSIIRHTFRYVVGIIMVLIGVYKLVMSDVKALGIKEYRIDIIEGIISIVVGVCSINFFYSNHACFFLGAIYLIMPIFRIIISENKVNQFFLDIMKYIFAGYIITNTLSIDMLVKVYVALTFIGIGAAIMIYRFIYYKNQSKQEDEVYQ